MAHSHLATWKPALASGSTFDRGNYRTGGVVSQQSSALDLPGHTKLKYRHAEQGLEVNQSLEDLEERERQAELEKVDRIIENQNDVGLLEGKELEEFDDRDENVSSDQDGSDSSGSDEDSSDDEEEEIAKELERIRREREEKARKLEEETAQLEDKAKLLGGNPLLNNSGAGSGKMKRRWDADVVFRNQARSETQTKKRFINDTIRSDFHRQFLKKYIK
uniref:Cwf15/Cwc15 cell cycle control protein n=1 Tax=Mucochytrium quahogii TaxID=96639 RepID=A0A7S2W7L3_9STRA|mmetsp:Transcript_18436/g.30010  ORF Transcript_18436/g.30010 Transcript_18436/m.30010 type:complete len:219 (-) Transcript_18436:910-1566(-)